MRWWLIILGFFVSVANAQDLYAFHSVKKEKRFYHLLNELRCVVCQNQNLASSNADIAIELRNKIFVMVEKNKSNWAIKKYLTQRYGNYILLTPPFIEVTLVLWIFPFVILAAGIWVYCRSHRK